MTRILVQALLACMLAYSLPSDAANAPSEQLEDPVLEQRARALGKELRCLVCQNQSIDDSDAELARELRLVLREKLLAGNSDSEIKDFLVARYGEFVLLKPPLSPSTYLLWFGPAVILALGVFGLWRVRAGKRDGAAQALESELSEQEREALKSIMADQPEQKI